MKQTITATVSAILIALSLVGLNADQAIAQGKARKGAKVRAGSNARVAKTQGQAKMHLEDISLGAKDNSQDNRLKASDGNRRAALELENTMISGVKGKSNDKLKAGSAEVLNETVTLTAGAKRRKGRKDKVKAGWDIRTPKQ